MTGRKKTRSDNKPQRKLILSSGLLLMMIGILTATFSIMEYDHFGDSKSLSEHSPEEIRSFLDIPQTLLAAGSISGVILAAIGGVKCLADIYISG